jgi:paraquat-inducible protein A
MAPMRVEIVCPTCLLRQELPEGARLCRCARCGGRIHGPIDLPFVRRRVRIFALSALMLYPLAIGLPVMSVQRLGHRHETGILRGTIDLMAADELVLGLLLLICSVILPLAKLAGLLALAAPLPLPAGWPGRLLRLIEGAGRWGMLDVLLVAMLAALVKLGDIVRIEVGLGATTFVACVVLSLLASASFDSRLVFIDPAPGTVGS